MELQKFYNDKFAEEITANTIKHYHAKAYNVYEDGKLVMKFENKLKTKASHRTLPLIPSIADVLRAKKEQDEYLSTVLKS